MEKLIDKQRKPKQGTREKETEVERREREKRPSQGECLNDAQWGHC